VPALCSSSAHSPSAPAALWEEHCLAAVRIKNTLSYLSALPVRAKDSRALETLLQGEGLVPTLHRSALSDRTKKALGAVEAPQTDGALNRKRPREHSDSDPTAGPNGDVPWETVLEDLQGRLALRPVLSQIKGQKSALCLESDHTPLLQVSAAATLL
jgi:hypothetical protein